VVDKASKVSIWLRWLLTERVSGVLLAQRHLAVAVDEVNQPLREGNSHTISLYVLALLKTFKKFQNGE
jgi:hypothetical protein